MAILAGGAMRVVDRKKKSATIADDCIGFLDLVWHGAHDGGIGADREICARVQLADDTPRGQFEFYFCSTHCLRKFFNACVDRLEMKISEAGVKLRKRNKQTSSQRAKATVLKPIPEKKMSKWARVGLQAHRRATRKKRAELRRIGLPMIIWKDGKVREVPA